MNTQIMESDGQGVLGQKFAFATASLIMGIACYVNLLGLEKGIVAIIFAWMALRSRPAPSLQERRGWAVAGMVMGIVLIVIVPMILLLNLDRITEIIHALSKLQGGR